jgi:hypothetical protein
MKDNRFVEYFRDHTDLSIDVNGVQVAIDHSEGAETILQQEAVITGKGGTTSNAGRAFVWAWRSGKRVMVTCQLQSGPEEQNRVDDALNTMEYVDEHFTWKDGRSVFTA